MEGLFLCLNKTDFSLFIGMVKREHIGTKQYSKVLNSNVEIREGLADEYYIKLGLASVLEEEPVKEEAPKKTKMSFPKHDSTK